MWTALIQTSDGAFTAHFSGHGLRALDFPGDARIDATNVPPADAWPQEIRAWLAVTREALAQALAGRQPAQLPPFDRSAGTAFQQRVWQALGRIPPGQYLTYSGLAAAIGRPKAVRAVGGACGANPIPVLIPCHRVLAAGGGLGGFSGGLDWKRRLLAREGVRVRPP